MATANKLKKYVTSIADAIREKKGTNELISPKDFGVEIIVEAGCLTVLAGEVLNVYANKIIKIGFFIDL